MHKWLWALSFILILVACDSEPPEKTVWDEQLNTLDKAHDIEQEILNAATLQRQQIDEQTQ